MKVLLLTGPGGAGKSTVAKLVVKKSGYVYLDGDHEDSEFFPEGEQWITENSELLQKAHKKILNKAKELVAQSKSVVVDYIIFGHYLEFIDMFKKEFGDDFQVKVLFPSKEELVKRDKKRKIWATGAERISVVSKEFESIKDKIGPRNFIDTTNQTPKETASDIF